MKFPLLKVFMAPEAGDAVARVLAGGWVGQGPAVDEFEARLAESLGVDPAHVVTVNSGTAALRLALRCAGVGAGHSVVTTPATNLATNSVILDAHAGIIWADVDPETGVLDAADVEPRIRPHTRAIMTMDWGGQVSDLGPLLELANRAPQRVDLIVDAAQSLGAAFMNGHPSRYAQYVCHSFQAVKQVNTVDGGALICQRRSDADRARLLRWFGLDRQKTNIDDPRCEQCDVTEHGYKMHMNDVAATVGLCNLRYLDMMLGHARDNAAYYTARFTDLRGVRPARRYDGRGHTYWTYTILADDEHVDRDALMAGLRARDIGASRVHARNDTHGAFSTFKTTLPSVDKFYRQQLAIPVGWWLSELDREYIADSVIDLTHALYR